MAVGIAIALGSFVVGWCLCYAYLSRRLLKAILEFMKEMANG
jgi:hypothetical protein